MKGPDARQKRLLAAALELPASLALGVYRNALRRTAPPLDLTDPAAATKVERVLVVRLDAIGDLLLSEPALAVLRQRFPDARIDLVASPVSAEVLQGNPHVDRLITSSTSLVAVWSGGFASGCRRMW